MTGRLARSRPGRRHHLAQAGTIRQIGQTPCVSFRAARPSRPRRTARRRSSDLLAPPGRQIPARRGGALASSTACATRRAAPNPARRVRSTCSHPRPVWAFQQRPPAVGRQRHGRPAVPARVDPLPPPARNVDPEQSILAPVHEQPPAVWQPPHLVRGQGPRERRKLERSGVAGTEFRQLKPPDHDAGRVCPDRQRLAPVRPDQVLPVRRPDQVPRRVRAPPADRAEACNRSRRQRVAIRVRVRGEEGQDA